MRTVTESNNLDPQSILYRPFVLMDMDAGTDPHFSHPLGYEENPCNSAS